MSHTLDRLAFFTRKTELYSSGHGVMEEDAPVGELVDRAVALLDEHERRFPQGAMALERGEFAQALYV